MAAKGKESLRHRLKVPDLGTTTTKGLLPLRGEVFRHFPAELIISKTSTNHVALLIHLSAINKALATMQDGKVVDEVDIASLGSNLKLSGLGNLFNRTESLNLNRRQLRQAVGAWVAWASHQRRSAKVGDQLTVLVVDNWAAVELGAGYAMLVCCSNLSLDTMTAYRAKGQSERARTRIKSGRVAARVLYTVYAEAMMHLPPDAAVLWVNQLMTSPDSSL